MLSAVEHPQAMRGQFTFPNRLGDTKIIEAHVPRRQQTSSIITCFLSKSPDGQNEAGQMSLGRAAVVRRAVMVVNMVQAAASAIRVHYDQHASFTSNSSDCPFKDNKNGGPA
jgi:hypothetical protein